MTNTSFHYDTQNGLHQGQFQAMASPCQLLVEAPSDIDFPPLLEAVQAEALRIEHKFSRYRTDNLIHRINHHELCVLDPETRSILDFAQQCFELSDGLFDITSGILRQLWNFKTMTAPPSQAKIDQLLPYIGWHKVSYSADAIQLPDHMEIDLGGIGKEYAVDKCWQILKKRCPSPFLINFGGDLRVSGPRREDLPWRTGIENPNGHRPSAVLEIQQGAITTSGTTMQHFTHNGIRYGHILNPKTGWPIIDPPESITVAAPTCIEAGLLSTLAMLHGLKAHDFLSDQGVTFWLQSPR